MDIDAFVAAHQDQWERLDTLVDRRRLSGAQADELVGLYRAAARHLAQVTAQAPDPVVLAELSTRVVRARGRVTASSSSSWVTGLTHLVAVSMPAALYRVRWWTLGVSAVGLALAVVTALWTLHSPEAMASLGSPAKLDHYADHAFSSYYSTYDPQDFAAQVWTNNARIAALCVAGGITGVLPAAVLWFNVVHLGQVAAIMADHHALPQFLSLIAPHGLLELTSVFVAGGAGLKLFWTLLVPGPRPRGRALASEARSLMTVSVALTVALAVSGLIEAFVTPAPIPWAVKVAVGVLALALLWAYTIALGRRAVATGVTGDLDEHDAGYQLPVAA
ncbi:stage II sporulation protein M [Actinomyces sp. HMT897]|uniref:stage II sporulation protein M n=1 Tax=Actinomyces sp. HMT897 TaxID=2789424 RepID=UPI00190AACDC|nr:stage II sporulation protein M [Actinomyces sp. HMT897]QQO78316.1 stage II sporulation protein M [Actinomyces sp. HMT897]